MNGVVGTDEHGGVPSHVMPNPSRPAYWRLEMVAATDRPRNPHISPDGATVLFILDRDTSDVWRIPVTGGSAQRVTVDRELAPFWEDTEAVWSPDGSRIAYAANGRVKVAPATGGPSTDVDEGGAPVWADDRRLLITVEHEGPRLALVDADGPWPRPLDDGGGDCSQVVVSPDRRSAAYTFAPDSDLNRSDIRIVDLEAGDGRSITGLPGYHDHSPAFSPDGVLVVFASERSGWNELYVVASNGSGQRQLTFDEHDFSEPRWNQNGDRIAAVRTRAGVSDLVTVDPVTGEVTTVAAGGIWATPSWTTDGRIVATFESHDTPPRLCVVDRDGTVTVLIDGAPAPVTAAPYVTPKAVTFRSLDGVDIPGFLFKPAAAADRPVPVIIYPHGGPTSYYGDEWDGIAQYFLDKGYAWFAINFRGSTSYGVAFERSNHGVWGTADTDDCLASADYLRNLDWIDPRRIAIFGASYGSYLALASLVRDEGDRFACGVAKYGDCDILTSWAQGDRGGRVDLERMMGHPSTNPDGYRSGSPIHDVASVSRPLFVAHGELDERVSPAQSEELVAELRRLGKTFEYVTYPTEGHGLLRTEPMVHFYRRLERFFDWYLM